MTLLLNLVAICLLHALLLGLVGHLPTMIERDQNIPGWEEMEKEIGLLGSVRLEKGGSNARRAATGMATEIS